MTPKTILKSVRLPGLAFGLAASLLAPPVYATDMTHANAICSKAVIDLNTRFSTVKGLNNGDLPLDSGVIVHTLHGPGTSSQEMNIAALNKVPVDTSKSCGDYLTASPPVYLPWCGSNTTPSGSSLADASSWTFIRQDTLINGRNAKRPDEVVCDTNNNKRYGLIFSNAFMNTADNLGCMYPLDGDTGFRLDRGCGLTTPHNNVNPTDGFPQCPLTDKASDYLDEFKTLTTEDGGAFASFAGSLVCSLGKSQFDIWVDARKNIDLQFTDWPVTEFVLWNWDEYTTADLAKQGILEGVYYLTGCTTDTGPIPDGTQAEAQEIADLYKKWTGIELPVVNLSNAAMRQNGNAPFSCQ